MKNTISVIGKSKTGKTNILFNEVSKKINDGDNLLILDTKLEYYNHFYNELKNNEYKIQVVNLSEPLKSDGWNPLYENSEDFKNAIDHYLQTCKDLNQEPETQCKGSLNVRSGVKLHNEARIKSEEKNISIKELYKIKFK